MNLCRDYYLKFAYGTMAKVPLNQAFFRTFLDPKESWFCLILAVLAALRFLRWEILKLLLLFTVPERYLLPSLTFPLILVLCVLFFFN